MEELRNEDQAPSDKRRRPPSAEELERVRKREELQLARKRVLGDMETARHPRHKELLERTLADLDKRIHELEGKA
ncbi:MAG TPA: hypothetical protein VKG84_02385 [Candidatus Acidoferrales bacterium]|nr:hypothetical protein [Candidatus Acidoferrales bacterium]